MDQLDIAEDLQQVKDQVAILGARGYDVTLDEAIASTLKRGLQEMIDHRTDGSYYTVKWSANGKRLEVFDIYRDRIGQVEPESDSLVQDFHNSDQLVWNRFDIALRQLISR
ncbi:hypothetical protein [Convivina intestini]|uniref:Uncharacterized protein n=1 Tax=Convivina intestini TaxID=1505726 RepID=A0A2U1D9D9_9LACO|nr:hypothetical protein [Convivina intestini]PVY84301.1 hypothetical protein C7384_10446 [Convivina intestini]CAH1855451.1 hypothetical protein R077811_01063 [Convivina intestini]SDB94065.1 hypothetical protein SAMN05216341_10645 [Leuconostocaceae bacterium R-53105]